MARDTKNRTASSTTDRKKAAAARAKAKAQENQTKYAGKSYLKYSGKMLEYKDGKSTLISVIPYIVKEKRHPDGVAAGELWYKRPFRIHKDVGAGDDKKTYVCPRSFHPRANCAICDNVAELSKNYEANKDQIGAEKAKNRDLMLAYNHDSKEVCLLNEPYGGGNMVGFGMLLDSRLANARQEEWAAFWLDGDDGMALDIAWKGAGLGGKKDWVKPISIDFVARSQAPVPKDIWGKALELSELLVQTSSKTIEQAYYELPPDEDGNGGEENPPDEEKEDSKPAAAKRGKAKDQEPPPEEEPEPEDDIPFEEKDFDQQVEVLQRMSVEDLLQFAKRENLKDENGKDISRFHRRKNQKELAELVVDAWDKATKEPEPEDGVGDHNAESSDGCPHGHEFGKDFNDKYECADCKEECYNACADACPSN